LDYDGCGQAQVEVIMQLEEHKLTFSLPHTVEEQVYLDAGRFTVQENGSTEAEDFLPCLMASVGKNSRALIFSFPRAERASRDTLQGFLNLDGLGNTLPTSGNALKNLNLAVMGILEITFRVRRYSSEERVCEIRQTDYEETGLAVFPDIILAMRRTRLSDRWRIGCKDADIRKNPLRVCCLGTNPFGNMLESDDPGVQGHAGNVKALPGACR
jgi:hypothetical protein